MQLETQSLATYVTCTKCVQVSLSETCKFLHPSCMKTCNAFALLVFMQLGCTQYEIHEFLREHVQRKSVARKRATLLRCTCMELARSLHGACTQTCQVLCQSTYANFFGIYIKRSIHTKSQQHPEFSPAPQHTTQNITRLSPPPLPLPPLPPRLATATTSASAPPIPRQ